MRHGLMVAALAAWMLAVLPAAAGWIAYDKPDPTFGGTRATLAGQTDRGGEVQILCNGANRSVNFLFPDGFSMEEGRELRLSFLTDNGQVWAGPAKVYRASGGFFALSYQNKSDLEGIVADIVAAKTELVITIEDTPSGMVSIYVASAKGSTAAGRAFQQSCFDDAPTSGTPVQAEAPAAAPESAVAGGDWVYEEQTETASGSPQATVAGDLDQGGYLAAYCLGPSLPALAFLSTKPETFPYEAGDVGLSIHLEIDGEDIVGVGEYFRRQDGVQGIMYADTTYLESIFERLGGANAEVAVLIQSYSNGLVTRWPAKSLNGLRSAISRLQATCFATTPVAATPVTSVPPANAWEVTQYISDVEAGYRAVLTARTVSGRGFMRVTCSLDAGTWTLGIYADVEGELPFRPGSYPLRVGVDGLFWDLPAGSYDYESAGEGAGVVASGENAVVEFISVLSLDHKDITVEVVGTGAVYGVVPEGSVEAGLKMFSTCYALN